MPNSFLDERFRENQRQARLVGLRRETVIRLEKAQYNPSLKLTIEISPAGEVPLEEILVFESPPGALAAFRKTVSLSFLGLGID